MHDRMIPFHMQCCQESGKKSKKIKKTLDFMKDECYTNKAD